MSTRLTEDGSSDSEKARLRTDPTIPWPYEYSPLKACPMCAGRGAVLEMIDRERFPVPVPCDHCRRYCAECKRFVPKAGHVCGPRVG